MRGENFSIFIIPRGLWIFNFENWTESLMLSNQTIISAVQQGSFFRRSLSSAMFSFSPFHGLRKKNLMSEEITNFVQLNFSSVSFHYLKSFSSISPAPMTCLPARLPPPVIEKQFNVILQERRNLSLTQFPSAFISWWWVLQWCLHCNLSIYSSSDRAKKELSS